MTTDVKKLIKTNIPGST